jgi:thiamine-monophosphate kinase
MSRTELKEIGEFGLIERISSKIKPIHQESLKGIGDDAAVIDIGQGKVMLISTDMMVEGIHFDLSYVPLKYLGYKAISSNVSDIAAMNGIPGQVTVSLALSSRFSLEAIDELYEGIRTACADFKVDVVGGDTTSSTSGLIINIAIVGQSTNTEVVYRDKAKDKDIICVTGDLGGAYLGLQVLEREKQAFLANPDIQPELEGKDYVVQKQLKPNARMDLIYELKELKVLPTAMIDISDGLASELLHICTQSALGAVIYEDKLPIDPVTYETAREFNLDPLTCMLNGGEDYELLFTIKQSDYEKLRNHPDISFIGYMKEKEAGVNLVTKAGNVFPVKAQGWVHF